MIYDYYIKILLENSLFALPQSYRHCQGSRENGNEGLWLVAWNTWYSVGHKVTHPFLCLPVDTKNQDDTPSQSFLTNLMKILPLIYPKISHR